MSSNGHNGEHRYSGDRWSPGQGRPWLMVEEMKEPDHPGRRKSSGFFQPIKHLSGKKNWTKERQKYQFSRWSNDLNFPRLI